VPPGARGDGADVAVGARHDGERSSTVDPAQPIRGGEVHAAAGGSHDCVRPRHGPNDDRHLAAARIDAQESPRVVLHDEQRPGGLLLDRRRLNEPHGSLRRAVCGRRDDEEREEDEHTDALRCRHVHVRRRSVWMVGRRSVFVTLLDQATPPFA
jgi:hypothetical protein